MKKVERINGHWKFFLVIRAKLRSTQIQLLIRPDEADRRISNNKMAVPGNNFGLVLMINDPYCGH